METVKGVPFFTQAQEKLNQYPYLDKNLECEILIIGAGIDGSIANYYLSKNHDVVLVDKSKIGFGCTSCATALLEYQLDEFASDLLPYLTENEIVQIYQMGIDSVQKIKEFVKKHGNKCHFFERPTFLYTESSLSSAPVIEEFNFRRKNGFNCELITENNNPFPFKVSAGIFCENGGCEFNPYLFTKQMIENSKNQNHIFENTKIEKLTKNQDGTFIASTNFGNEIKCEKIILATGFNWEVIDENNLCERFVSYSIVTNPVNINYFKNSLVHNTKSPYNYMRTLPDGRIIFGGEDLPFNEKKGITQKDAEKKYASLEKSLKQLFPENANKISISNKFCGLFGTTKNNLGLIGESKTKNLFYFISCGANGIINAMFGVELLEDLFSGRQNELASQFSPLREDL